MKIYDYKKEKDLLDQLAVLKEAKKAQAKFNPNYEAAKIFVRKAWEGELGEDAQKYIEDVIDLVNSQQKAVELIKRTLDNVNPIMKEANVQKKNMKTDEDGIKNNIGEIMKEILHDNSLVVGDYTFPKFGTVRCTLKKTNVIKDEVKLKESLAKNSMWDSLKLGTSKQIQELDASKLEGIENEDVPTITITQLK